MHFWMCVSQRIVTLCVVASASQQFAQNDQAQQQQKLQMARNIVQAYTGRVTIDQVLAMPFDRVQGLHNEIVSRLNQTV